MGFGVWGLGLGKSLIVVEGVVLFYFDFFFLFFFLGGGGVVSIRGLREVASCSGKLSNNSQESRSMQQEQQAGG